MDQPNFLTHNNLVPAVIQDYATEEVLMVGYMNLEAWRLTQQAGKVHYYSRKKKRIWLKGEQSGNYQIVKQIFMNCDNTCLLIKVEQLGGACDQGFKSCFDKVLTNEEFVYTGELIFDPKSAYGGNFTQDIVLGIPSGSLEKMTFQLLNLSGYKIERPSDRSYHPIVGNEPNLKLIMARAQELPELLDKGLLDAAITGIDLIREADLTTIKDLGDLGYNKLGLGPVMLALAIPSDNKLLSLNSLQGKKIATAYPKVTQRFFDEKKISVCLVPSQGATEGKVPWLADAIVDLVESGMTLEFNNLKPIVKLLETTVHLITTNSVWGYTWKRRALEKLAKRLIESSRGLPKNSKRIIELPMNIS